MNGLVSVNQHMSPPLRGLLYLEREQRRESFMQRIKHNYSRWSEISSPQF